MLRMYPVIQETPLDGSHIVAMHATFAEAKRHAAEAIERFPGVEFWADPNPHKVSIAIDLPTAVQP